jgi:ElaB/YqjD/DUF883 family membrane-anchored ribosome-binding protein
MTSRNQSEPFDEVAHPGGAAARMVEDTVMPVVPVAPVDSPSHQLLQHTHAADRALAPPSRTGRRAEKVANGLGQWIGYVRRRFETVRQHVRQKDGQSIKADAMTFARRYPMQALAGTVLAGFVIGRLLRRK